jgi:hypothetical protein
MVAKQSFENISIDCSQRPEISLTDAFIHLVDGRVANPQFNDFDAVGSNKSPI